MAIFASASVVSTSSAVRSLCEFYVVFVPVVRRSSRCGSTEAYHIICFTTGTLDCKLCLHPPRRSSVHICVGSAYLAYGLMFEISSLNTWLPEMFPVWPSWSYVLFASSPCRPIVVCSWCLPSRSLYIRQSVLIRRSVHLDGHLKWIGEVLSRSGLKYDALCH